MNDANTTVLIQGWLDKVRQGDAGAREELITAACDRLEILARRMLRRFPKVRRWEQTGDVHSEAFLRLHNAISDLEVTTPREFFALAALQTRRVLLDFARKYGGRDGKGGREAVMGEMPGGTDSDRQIDPAAAFEDSPEVMAQWTEFFKKIEELPQEERELVDLLYFQGLTQKEVAEQVLMVDPSTVKRRWRRLRINLGEIVEETAPEES